MRLKFAFEPIIGGVWGDEPKGDANDMVCVRVADFDDLSGTVSTEKLTQRHILPSEQRGRVLHRGDLLLEKSGGGEQSAVGRSVRFENDFKAVSSNFIALLRPHKVHDAKFLTYLMRATYHGGGSIPHIKQTTGIQNLDCSSYLSQDFNFPKLAEQRRIADYLDAATGKIDRLVGLRRRQMELLQEQRAALIQQAVTRGLDPNAPLKDSGIPWLGQIPEHWEVKRLKHITSQVTVGIVINPSSFYVEDGVPCLRSLNVRPGELITDNLVFISSASHRVMSKSTIYRGDLVAVRTGQPGTTAVVDERFDNTNCIDLIIIRKSSRFVSEFLAHILNSGFAKAQFDAGSDGAIQQHFNIQTAENLFVMLPPPDEQKDIVAHIQNVTAKLDALYQSYARQIEMLEEYRAALIHEAVTGQKAV